MVVSDAEVGSVNIVVNYLNDESAYNRLIAQLRGIGSAGSNAADDVRNEMDRVPDSVNRVNGAVKGLMTGLKALVGVAALKGLYDFGAAFYKEAVLDNVAAAKLGSMMKTRMESNKAEIDSVKQLIDVQERLGVVGGREQENGAQELASYLTKAESLKKLIPIMNNLAAQQYGVSATAENLAEVGTRLGKAMDGNYEGLVKNGFAFTDAQKQVMKYGDEQQRVALLSNIVTAGIGEMNYALGNTPEGRMAQLKNELGSIKAAIGNELIPLIIQMIPVIRAVAYVALDATKSILGFISSLFGVKLDMSAVTQTTEGAYQAAEDLGGSYSKVAKEAKKAKNAVASFDELIQISSPSGGGDAKSKDEAAAKKFVSGLKASDLFGKGGFSDLPSKMLLDKANEKLDAMKKKVWDILEIVGWIGAAYAGWKLLSLSNAISDIVSKSTLLNKAVKGTGTNVFGLLGSVLAGVTIGAFSDQIFNPIVTALGMGEESVNGKISKMWLSIGAAIAVGFAIGGPVGAGISAVIAASIIFVKELGKPWLELDTKLIPDGVGETTKKKLEPFLTAMREFQQELNILEIGRGIITEDDLTNLESKAKAAVDILLNNLSTERNDSLAALAEMKDMMSPDVLTERIAAVNKYYDDMEKDIKDGQARIMDIFKTAQEDHRKLTDAEWFTVLTIQKDMQKEGTTALADSKKDLELIEKNFNEQKGKMATEDITKALTRAAQAHKDITAEAQKGFDDQMVIADRMKEKGTITDAQYKQWVTDAENHKKKMVDEADSQWKTIKENAVTKLGDMRYAVNIETGELYTGWKVITNGLGKLWTDMWDGIKGIWSKIFGKKTLDVDMTVNTRDGKVPLDDSLRYTGNTSGQGLAVGGVVTRPTKRILGEQGKELIIPFERSSALDALAEGVASRGGGGGGATLNLYVTNAYGDEQSMNDLSKGVARKLTQQGIRIGDGGGIYGV
jgi:hypothetical protein